MRSPQLHLCMTGPMMILGKTVTAAVIAGSVRNFQLKSIGFLSTNIQQKVERENDKSGNIVPIAKIDSDHDSGILTVKWENGDSGRFAYVWLRDNATEPHTYNNTQRCRARVMAMQQLDTEICPKEVNVYKNGSAVEVIWPAPKTDDPPIKSIYTSHWLQQRNFGNPAFYTGRRPLYYQDYTRWDRNMILEQVMDKPTDFQKIFDDEIYLLDEMERFMKYGFLHFINMPKDADQMERFRNLIGFGCSSHYGSVFHVRTAIGPSSLAYTSGALPLHTDIPCMHAPPHIQMLHAIEQSDIGGENQFCDGLRVASEIKRDRPDLYKLLSTVPIQYADVGHDAYPYIMLAKWPVISMGAERGDVDSIFYSDHMRSWLMDTEPHNVRDMYRALKMFNEYCYEPRNLLQFKLKAGEMVMMGNNRILHGRSEFRVEPGKGGQRYYLGAYLNFDPLLSLIRSLRQKHGKQEYAII